MTPAQKLILSPYAEKLEDMVASSLCSDEQNTASLLSACEAASRSNCAWSVYAAAQLLLPYVKAHLSMPIKASRVADQAAGETE